METLNKSMAEYANNLAKRQHVTMPTEEEIIAEIMEDKEIKDFYDNNHPWADKAFRAALADLYNYVLVKQNKKKIPNGYTLELQKENGYPIVVYKPKAELVRKLTIDSHLENLYLSDNLRDLNFYQVMEELPNVNPQKFRDSIIKLVDDVLKPLVINFLNGEPNQQGIFLAGAMGVGKTYVMAAVANEISAYGKNVLMVHFPSLVTEMRNNLGEEKNTNKQILNKLCKADFLILDDVGAESYSTWVRDDILTVILEYRMQNNLCTCFTSNFDFDGYEEHLANTSKEGENRIKAQRLMERVRYLASNQYYPGIDSKRMGLIKKEDNQDLIEDDIDSEDNIDIFI